MAWDLISSQEVLWAINGDARNIRYYERPAWPIDWADADPQEGANIDAGSRYRCSFGEGMNG